MPSEPGPLSVVVMSVFAVWSSPDDEGCDDGGGQAP